MLDIKIHNVHLMFMTENTRKSRTEARIRDLDTMAEMHLRFIRRLRNQVREAKPGPEADALVLSLVRLTRGLRETIALCEKFARDQAARDARSAREAVKAPAPTRPPADADMRTPRPAASLPARHYAKSRDRGPPNG